MTLKTKTADYLTASSRSVLQARQSNLSSTIQCSERLVLVLDGLYVLDPA